jgi:hypothetical protein
VAIVWITLVALYGVIHVLSFSRRSATFDRAAGELRVTNRLGRLVHTIPLDHIDTTEIETELRPGGLFCRFIVRTLDGKAVRLSPRWNRDQQRFERGEAAILRFLGKHAPETDLVMKRASRTSERKQCYYCDWMESWGCGVLVDLTSPDGQQLAIAIPRCWRCDALQGGLLPGIGMVGGLALTTWLGFSAYPHVGVLPLVLVGPFLFFGLAVGGAFLMIWLFGPKRFGIPDEGACLQQPDIADLVKDGWDASIRRWNLSD